MFFKIAFLAAALAFSTTTAISIKSQMTSTAESLKIAPNAFRYVLYKNKTDADALCKGVPVGEVPMVATKTYYEHAINGAKGGMVYFYADDVNVKDGL